VDPARNRRRWYSVHWQVTLFGEIEVTCRWGRLGFVGGQTQILRCATPEEAQAATERIAKQRRRHGYVACGASKEPLSAE
jgi:predicted DNA-binding WGR domain protein